MTMLTRTMKLGASLLLSSLICPLVSNAESTVYVFMPSMDTKSTTTLSVNGIDAGDFKTDIMQHIDSNEKQVEKLLKKNPNLQIPVIKEMDIMFPTVKKCVLKSEGPTLFIVEASGNHPSTGAPFSSKLETTLDIEDGGIYYVGVEMANLNSDILYNSKASLKDSKAIKEEMDNNGNEMPNLQLQRLSEEIGKKRLKDKKTHQVSQYVEE